MAKKKQRTGTPKKAKKVQPRARKAKKKTAKGQPHAKKKAAAKKSLAKQVKAELPAKNVAQKKASIRAARTAFVAAAPGGAPNILGSDKGSDIVLGCAGVTDPETSISDLEDPQLFNSCVSQGVDSAGFVFQGIPASASTLFQVISAIAKCPAK